jgi:hypothetical protein
METIIEKFFTIYGLIWSLVIIIISAFAIIMFPKILYDRKKNKEDDYYSKNIKR